jgi:polysaccharide deacetylase 2 family uncharacterized protein YibQ
MAAKKKRRKGRKKKGRFRKTWPIIASLLGGIVLLVGLYVFFILTRPTSILLYEEIYGANNQLAKEISKIDSAVYEALFLEGVSEENVFFTAVEAQSERNRDWDFTDLMVRVSDEASFLKLRSRIDSSLSTLSPVARYRAEQRSTKEWVCHIYALDFYTHRVRLMMGGFRDKPSARLAKISIIVDDLGHDRELAEAFVRLNFPLAISVLPVARHTEAVVRLANQRKRELMLHLPMEPKNYPELDPGPGALMLGMKEEEIKRTINKHLGQVHGARGVNNHMGSLFTENKNKMAVVMGELKKRGLFYVDSRTTSETAAFRMAKEAGVPVASRSVFLDNDLSEQAMSFQMERLLGVARHGGSAIGIAHPHEETRRFLQRRLPDLGGRVRLVPVSDLVS